MTSKSSVLVLFITLAAGIAAAQPMSGTYYIQKGVSNDNTFPSFVAAGQALESRGLGGDVTFLAYAGVYDEGTCNLRNVAGSSSYVTTFDKKPGEGEVLVRGGTYGFYINSTHKVRIRNLTIRAVSYGTYSTYSNGVKVEACRIGGTYTGCHVGYAYDDSVVGCVLTPVGIGINLDEGIRNHVSNNMVAGYTVYAVSSSYNDYTEVYDNTFTGASSYCIYSTNAAYWSIKGNIFKHSGTYILYMPQGGLAASDFNDLFKVSPAGNVARYGSATYQTLAQWQVLGFDGNSIADDPLIGGLNPHLRTGSPCIDKGTAIPGITTDIDGDDRGSLPDIGADEYTGPPGDPLSGIYTIKQDGSGNYSSVFSAIMDLGIRGFGGDVTFDVYSGTYAEPIRCFDLNNGAYFLTFQAHVGTGGTDQVYIGTGVYYACHLTDAGRIRLTDLNFLGYSSYGAYNQTMTAVTPYIGCDYVTYRRCTFTGERPMYWWYSSNYDSVIDCQLYATSTYGIYSVGASSYPSGPNVFINNFIVGFTSYGIYSYYNSGNQYYYNTFYSPSSIWDVYEHYYTGTPPTFRDNIFYNGNTSTSAYAVYLYGSPTPPVSVLDYNCWWHPAGTNIAYINGYHTWASLRAAGYEANGINQDPLTGGVLNPHLKDGSPCIDKGTAISGIATDIDGDPRGSSPDIGADEWTGTVGEPMSGIYTVKQAGGGDFTSITEALSALALRGFGGDVQFDVYAGTYAGMYILSDVGNGANWLTLRAYPGENVALNAAGSSYNWYMRASKRIRVDGFKMTGASSYGVYMYYAGAAPYNGCDTCVIRNNTINAPAGIYSNYADDDTIDGNTISATSSYGIYLSGYSTVGQYNVRHVITNNTISGFTGNGIYASYLDSLRIKGNTVTGPTPIYVYRSNYDTIAGNYCHATGTGSNYGMYISGNSSSPYGRGFVIANNMIDGAYYGLQLQYASGAKLAYNSIQCSNTGYAGLYSYQNYGLVMHNNVFDAPSSGYAMYYYYGDAFPASSDNNDFYTGGAYVVNHYSGGVMDLATWQSYSGKDASSISADPMFKSATDDHLLATSPCIGAGVPFPGILKDIDGNKRSVWLPPLGPCIGADEYTLPPGWAAMASLPGVVGGGGWLAHKPGERYVYAARGNESGDFYRYDIVTNSWSALAPIPAYKGKLPYDGARGVHSGGDYIYATTGNVTKGFWRYKISEDKWEPRADPLEKLLIGTDLVYVPGTPDYVYLASGQKGEFYRYDVSLDKWTGLGKVPPDTEGWHSGSFLAFDGNQTIYAHRASPAGLRAYNVGTGLWGDALPGMPGKKSKDGGCGDWYDGSIYALKGKETSEFWQWDAATQLWDALDPFQGGEVDKGADIISQGNGTFFALKGGQTAEFWRFVLAPATNEGVQSRIVGNIGDGRMRLAVAPSVLVGPVLNLRYSAVRPGPARVTLFDILGRAVVRRDFVATRDGRLAVDLRKLSAGVYLVRLDDGEQQAVRKLVVQR